RGTGNRQGLPLLPPASHSVIPNPVKRVRDLYEMRPSRMANRARTALAPYLLRAHKNPPENHNRSLNACRIGRGHHRGVHRQRLKGSVAIGGEGRADRWGKGIRGETGLDDGEAIRFGKAEDRSLANVNRTVFGLQGDLRTPVAEAAAEQGAGATRGEG